MYILPYQLQKENYYFLMSVCLFKAGAPAKSKSVRFTDVNEDTTKQLQTENSLAATSQAGACDGKAVNMFKLQHTRVSSV